MRITRTAHRKINSFTCRDVMGPVGICLLITVMASFAVASVWAGEVTPYIPVLTGYADCISDCALEHPDLGDEYDACVAECDEQYGRQAGSPNPSGPPAASASSQQSRQNLALFREAIAWTVAIQQMRETGADSIQVIDELEAYFMTQWNDRHLRARLVDPYFVACVREIALSDQTREEAETLHDMLFRVTRSDQLDRISAIGRGCLLALSLWLAESPAEREMILRKSARYDLVEVVTILARILEDYTRGANGGDDAIHSVTEGPLDTSAGHSQSKRQRSGSTRSTLSKG